MKVENMTSSKGNKIANQFIISLDFWRYIDDNHNIRDYASSCNIEIFQSYNSIIAVEAGNDIYIDRNKWDYSVTTGKYRNQFLGETKKETQAKIDSGEYILADLN
jgi:hypothetical protein